MILKLSPLIVSLGVVSTFAIFGVAAIVVVSFSPEQEDTSSTIVRFSRFSPPPLPPVPPLMPPLPHRPPSLPPPSLPHTSKRVRALRRHVHVGQVVVACAEPTRRFDI